MYHSVTFQKEDGSRVNTWNDWHLIPSSRPVIAQPTPVYKFVDIPGRNGPLDLSEYLTGKVSYSDRKGSLEFLAVNAVGDAQSYSVWNYSLEAALSYGEWTGRRDWIAGFLAGGMTKIFLEDDPNYYYYGRVMFKEWRPDPHFSKVIIDYQVRPFRYLVTGQEVGL